MPTVSTASGDFTLVISPALDWHEASLACIASGASLASIRSEAENDLVKNLCGSHECWIGFNDVLKERSWVWTDGWQGTYTHWVEGEPNGKEHENTDGAYMRNWGNGGWDDTAVTDIKPYVCRFASPTPPAFSPGVVPICPSISVDHNPAAITFAVLGWLGLAASAVANYVLYVRLYKRSNMRARTHVVLPPNLTDGIHTTATSYQAPLRLSDSAHESTPPQ